MGVVKCDGLEVAALNVDAQHSPPSYKFKYSNLRQVNVKREQLEEIFKAEGRDTGRVDDDEWCP